VHGVATHFQGCMEEQHIPGVLGGATHFPGVLGGATHFPGVLVEK